MGGRSNNEVKETPQQRALVEHALNQFADWKTRWLPVQKNLAAGIKRMGAEGSAAREAAKGRSATDTEIQFTKAQGVLEKSLSNSGAAVGSSKFNLGVSGLGEDKAKSKGLGVTAADQMIDDAYVQGLQALTSVGRGERAQVTDSLGRQAQMSGRQAAADADAALAERAGQMRIGGQLAGFGLSRSLGPSVPTDGGSVPGGYSGPDGTRFNNPSAYVPAG